MRIVRVLGIYLAVIGLSCFASARAEERLKLGLPLSLSPVKDPWRQFDNSPQLLLGMQFIEAFITDETERLLRTDISGSQMELAYLGRDLLPRLSWQTKLRYRELTYHYINSTVIFDQLFRTRSSNQLYETYWNTDFAMRPLPGLMVIWNPEIAWVSQTFESEFFADDHRFQFVRQGLQIYGSLAQFIMGLSYRAAIYQQAGNFTLRHAASRAIELSWRPDNWSLGLKAESRQESLQDENLKDSWHWIAGIDWQLDSYWQFAIYGDIQPAYYRNRKDATAGNIDNRGIQFIVEWRAYEDANVSAALRLSQSDYASEGRRLEYMSQRLILQFNYIIK